MYNQLLISPQALARGLTVDIQIGTFNNLRVDMSTNESVFRNRNIMDSGNLAIYYDSAIYGFQKPHSMNYTSQFLEFDFTGGNIQSGSIQIRQRIFETTVPPAGTTSATPRVLRPAQNWAQRFIDYVITVTADRTNNSVTFSLIGNDNNINMPFLINIFNI